MVKPGADPENVEPGGANSINYQTEPGGVDLFFGLTYKSEQGGVRRVRPPLNPRLIIPGGKVPYKAQGGSYIF